MPALGEHLQGNRDVFRAPSNPMLFCVSVGTGYQVYIMSFITIGFAALGFLSPANRGALMVAFLLLFVLLGITAGYKSARLYKNFRGKKWQRTTLLTALLSRQQLAGGESHPTAWLLFRSRTPLSES